MKSDSAMFEFLIFWCDFQELEKRIMLEYRMNGEEYRQKQRDFKIHDLKMRHIKQLVQEYDDVHYRSSASSSTSSSSGSAGDRTDRNSRAHSHSALTTR